MFERRDRKRDRESEHKKGGKEREGQRACAYARERSAMLAERDGKIAELRRKLRASEERCQSLLVTARHAIMSGAAGRNGALAEPDRPAPITL